MTLNSRIVLTLPSGEREIPLGCAGTVLFFGTLAALFLASLAFLFPSPPANALEGVKRQNDIVLEYSARVQKGLGKYVGNRSRDTQ